MPGRSSNADSQRLLPAPSINACALTAAGASSTPLRSQPHATTRSSVLSNRCSRASAFQASSSPLTAAPSDASSSTRRRFASKMPFTSRKAGPSSPVVRPRSLDAYRGESKQVTVRLSGQRPSFHVHCIHKHTHTNHNNAPEPEVHALEHILRRARHQRPCRPRPCRAAHGDDAGAVDLPYVRACVAGT